MPPLADLASAASTTIEEVAAAVADLVAELAFACAAAQGCTDWRLSRAEVVGTGPTCRAGTALKRSTDAVADVAAIGGAGDFTRKELACIGCVGTTDAADTIEAARTATAVDNAATAIADVATVLPSTRGATGFGRANRHIGYAAVERNHRRRFVCASSASGSSHASSSASAVSSRPVGHDRGILASHQQEPWSKSPKDSHPTKVF